MQWINLNKPIDWVHLEMRLRKVNYTGVSRKAGMDKTGMRILFLKHNSYDIVGAVRFKDHLATSIEMRQFAKRFRQKTEQLETPEVDDKGTSYSAESVYNKDSEENN